ncbi:hypothetical protein VKT23_017717 [Stygiomarasmius scandens]|uniref:Uncharacterized protein n=1 Tax=Marasmiellus scandens TaxID=2682957 RepID=A0ABR1IR51_9AGAR
MPLIKAVPYVLVAQPGHHDLLLAVKPGTQRPRSEKGLLVYSRARRPLPKETLFRFTALEPTGRKMQLGEREVVDGFVQWLEEDAGGREVQGKMVLECKTRRQANGYGDRTWDSEPFRPPLQFSTNLNASPENSDHVIECRLQLDDEARKMLAELRGYGEAFYPIPTASSPLIYLLNPDPETIPSRAVEPNPNHAVLPLEGTDTNRVPEETHERRDENPRIRIGTEEGMLYTLPLPSCISTNEEALPRSTTTSNPVNEGESAIKQRIGFLLDNACEVQNQPDLVHPLVIVTQWATLQEPRHLHGVSVHEGTGTDALFLYVNKEGNPAVRKGSFTYQANFDPYYIHLTPESYGEGAPLPSQEVVVFEAHNGKHVSEPTCPASAPISREAGPPNESNSEPLPTPSLPTPPASALAAFLGIREEEVTAPMETDRTSEATSTAESMPGLITGTANTEDGSNENGQGENGEVYMMGQTDEEETSDDGFPACTEPEIIPVSTHHVYHDGHPHPHDYSNPRLTRENSPLDIARNIEREHWAVRAQNGGQEEQEAACWQLQNLAMDYRRGRTTIEDITRALRAETSYPVSTFISWVTPIRGTRSQPQESNHETRPDNTANYPLLWPDGLAAVLRSFARPPDAVPAYSPHPEAITVFVGMVLQAFRERFVR